MEKYKIRITYGNDNLDNIVEKVLLKSVRYACKNNLNDVKLSCIKLSLVEGGKKN